MALPENLRHFVTAWESSPSDKQTLTELTSRLMIEEERNNGIEGSTALASKSKFQNSKRENNNQLKCYECDKFGHIKRNCPVLKSKKVCTYCKKVGHFVQNCWFKKNKESGKGKQEKQDNTQVLMVISSILKENNGTALFNQEHLNDNGEWWLDSGATEHMCSQIECFESVTELKERRQVKIGNGTLIEVHGVGEIQVQAWNGNSWVKTILKKVLFVPNLAVNLFSLSTVLDRGFEMHSNKDRCDLLDMEGRVIAVAVRQGNLYKMQFRSQRKVENGKPGILAGISQCNMVESLTEWHCKLAHINFEQVKNVLKHTNIQFKDEMKPFCTQCLTGKQHRLSFPMSVFRAEKTGKLIHADLCGPFEVASLGGAKYFLLLKDDFSAYRYVYFLQNKTETCTKIKNFITLAENITGNKLITFRSDNGLEFINKDLKNLFETKGIRHERSCSYTPQQNGRAERDMRTIVEAARTMLHSKNMKKHFWAEAVNCAVFTLNRVGSNCQKNESPFKLWHNKDFDLNFFKEFGTKVQVLVPKEKRLKLDSKSREGFFVGYSEETKGYRIYFEDKNNVETHRDVIFIPKVYQDVNCTSEKVEEKVIKLDLENDESESELEELENENQEIYEIENSHVSDENSSENSDYDQAKIQEVEQEDEPEIKETTRVNKRKIQTPAWMNDYETSFFSENENPICLEEALNGIHATKWKEAMDKELQVLEENNTWSETPWPNDKKVIESKWVFKRKSDSEFKARLVARGFQQESDDNTYDIYAPVAKLSTFRVLLVVGLKLGKPIFQMDVKSAFLYGEIKEEVYMCLPGKSKNNSSTVCRLNKSIYGLKRSPKCWNSKFDTLMKNEGFNRSENDYCLYSKYFKNDQLYVLLYVDDLLILGTNLETVNRLKSTLHTNFCMKDLGVISQYLGIDVKLNLNQGYIQLSQERYLNEVLQKYGMQDCKAISTPIDMNNDFKNFKNCNADPKFQNICRKIVGSLMYAVQGTRPDLCESVGMSA